MGLDDYGSPCPKRVPFSEDARAVFAQLVDELATESNQPGFPKRLQGPWAKMGGYLARLSLILALCRSVDGGETEKVHSRDVLSASVLLAYFKNQADRIYVGLYGEDPDDRLAADVVAFLQQQNGRWKGSATELHKQLVSSAKPDTPDLLSRKLGKIADYTSALSVKHGWAGNKRALTLTLENGVGSVGGVGNSDDCECGGSGCIECLKQELPFGNA